MMGYLKESENMNNIKKIKINENEVMKVKENNKIKKEIPNQLDESKSGDEAEVEGEKTSHNPFKSLKSWWNKRKQSKNEEGKEDKNEKLTGNNDHPFYKVEKEEEVKKEKKDIGEEKDVVEDKEKEKNSKKKEKKDSEKKKEGNLKKEEEKDFEKKEI
jgi:hypothetical protein